MHACIRRYVVLAILLVRGLTLEGASIGLRFYLEPRFEQVTPQALKPWTHPSSC